MKKKMKTIILLILIIGIVVGVIFTSNNKSYAAPDGTWQSSECSVDLGGYINSGGNSWMTSYWNTYCLQHGTALRDNMSELEVALADIGELTTRKLAEKHKPAGLAENRKNCKRRWTSC